MAESERMCDRILVAMDGSLPAQAAASLAIQIAASQNLSIRGLYVVDDRLVMDSYANYQAELGSTEEVASRADLVNQFRKWGDATLQWLEARCRDGNIPVTTDLLFGSVPELILQEASQAKLLALGRRGHGHAMDVSYLGRNFRAIAHHVHQPILVGGDELRSTQRLLLAYNGSERATSALAWATLLQRTRQSEVIALAVQENSSASQPWLSEMQAQLDTGGLANYRFASRTGLPSTEIVAAASEHQVDLIVMGRYRHTALLEWLVGSTLDRVLCSTRLPVLVV
jgi:nucleotide-binding universal stress UspA family protein